MVAQTILATLPSLEADQRLQVALRQSADGHLTIELREQHYGGLAVGWFDQRTIALEPCQWKQLQAVLGGKVTASAICSCAETRPATIPFPGLRPSDLEPRRSAIGEGA